MNRLDDETIFGLILFANMIKFGPLSELTAAAVANIIKDKTPEQIRQRFNIQNEFTPEEEEAVRRENEWADELLRNLSTCSTRAD